MIKKEKWQEKIKAYALKNAVEHEGKAQVDKVISSLFHEGLKKEEVAIIINDVKEQVKKINSLSIEQQKKEFSELEKKIGKRKQRVGLPELPNAKKGKVIMRFAPSASGPLHIGNALSALPSSLYVRKYKGKFYVRIEDTNPENVYPEAYKMIKEDCLWLFDKPIFIIQSDRMKFYYKYAEKLIKLGKAYVCTCKQKEMQKLRKRGIECSCRQFSIPEQIKRWKKMLDKKGYKEGQAILRFKGNMLDKNPALRDFPLARINLKKHPRVKNKYRVWPLMNLSVAVDDLLFKMTHIIRGKDHRDNAIRQEMIYKALGVEKIPWTAFLGRIHFSDMELSKTKIKQDIKQGKYSGWDDKRLPTIISLKKWGYKKEALEKIAIERGLSEVDKIMSKKDFYELLDRFNRETRAVLHQ